MLDALVVEGLVLCLSMAGALFEVFQVGTLLSILCGCPWVLLGDFSALYLVVSITRCSILPVLEKK